MADMTPTDTFPFGGVDGEFDPHVTNGRRFTLSRDFRVVLPQYKLDVTVPKEFVTDFNSVPRGLWDFFPPWECPEAGTVHDWLYQHPAGMNRGQVDNVHREVMIACGESAAKARTAWLGIRAGGWLPWRRYRKQGL